MPQPSKEVLTGRDQMERWEQAGVYALDDCPEDVGETWIDIALPGGDGWVSRTLVTFPKRAAPANGSVNGNVANGDAANSTTACPLVVLFHGGGFRCGSPKQVMQPARGYAHHFGAVVACPSYPFCPEQPFPASVHSAWRAIAWLSDAANLNGQAALQEAHAAVDPALGFVLGGLSAGGTMIAAITGILGTKDEKQKQLLAGLPPLRATVTGAFVGLPATVNKAMLSWLPDKYKALWHSREDNADHPYLTSKAIYDIEDTLAADYASPWYSPLAIAPEDLEPKNHPQRVFVQGCSKDPLRDDAIIYEQWLRDNGVAEDVSSAMMKGYGHCGWVTMEFMQEEKKQLRVVSLNGMGRLLGRKWDGDVNAFY